MEFLIGGLAGAGATIFTNPMDVVKTRMQLQGEMRARTEHKPHYRGVLHALFVIARTDGVLALWKGLVPAMIYGFTMNSVRLGIYRIAEAKGWTKNKHGKTSFRKAVFWSGFSGLVSGVAANPATVVKTRIQSASHPSIAVGRQHVYKGMLDAFTTIYKTEGLRGFFAGVEGSCVRLAIGSATQLTTFSEAKEVLLRYGMCKDSPFRLALSASAISGVAIVCIVCPMDVATVRLYNQGKTTDGHQTYSGMFDGLQKIFKNEGLHGLYKGIGPLYLRLAPHTIISLVIWDMLNIILLSNKSR